MQEKETSSQERLQEVISSASRSKDRQESREQLLRAFQLFSEETARLEAAYSRLQQRFNDVNRQLENTHIRLEEKIKQFDRVTHYLDSILRNVNQGLLFVSCSGMITTYNTAAEKILQINQRDVLFKNYKEVFSDNFFGFSMQLSIENFSCPQSISITYQKDSSLEKQLEISTSVIFQRNKMQQGILLLIKDVTEVRELQKKEILDQRMRQLGEMAASVAHEIRNPLGGIEGFAALLYKDLKDFPEMQKMAGYIIEGSRNISRLIENVLAYARPLHPQLSSCNLAQLMHELLDCISVDAYFPKNISIRLHAEEISLTTLLDKQMIQSALLHLLKNASHAMPDGGSIVLTLYKRKEKAVIAVRDSGCGIEEKHLERLFSPFFTTKPDGTGLGLYETYKIIQSHFGSIEVTSEKGKGTLFLITLPLRG